MFAPKTLNHAYSLAKLRESTLENEKKGKAVVKSSYTTSNWGPNVSKNVASNSSKGLLENPLVKNVNPTIKKLSPAEMQSRNERGLCYNCDKVYSARHKCKKQQLYMLMGEEQDGNDEISLANVGEEEAGHESIMAGGGGKISLNALSGTADFQTLKLRGFVKKKAITILVDSGSTHNFLDPSTAKQAGCIITRMDPLWVTVADGTKMCSKAECK